MENGGRFTDNQVDQLRRLEGGRGWSPKSAIVHLYIKKIIEEYSDTLALITPGRHGLISITFNFTIICQIDNPQHSWTLLSSSNVRTFSMTLEAVTANFFQHFPFVMGFLFNIDQLNKHKLCFSIKLVPWLLISIMLAISLLWHLQYLISKTEFSFTKSFHGDQSNSITIQAWQMNFFDFTAFPWPVKTLRQEHFLLSLVHCFAQKYTSSVAIVELSHGKM